MAAGVGRSNVEAEEAYMLAEESFLAGDVAGALLAAQYLFRPLSGLAGALAAAAAPSRASGTKWYAVLGCPSSTSGGGFGATLIHGAIKRRYRRLCLVLHPDKNRSAAADGAFKLLQKALSARHPPAPVRSPRQPPPAGTDAEPAAPPEEKFPRPARCRRCRTRYASPPVVFVGTWHLRCMGCHEYTMDNVRSPDDATPW